MRSLVIPVLTAVALALLASACSPPAAPTQPLPQFAVCEGRYRTQLLGLESIYPAAVINSCKQAILPYDLGAWIEAPLNSHKSRGLRTVVMGCANLTPDAADCSYGGQLGHSVTVQANFDLAMYPDRALVQKAMLAVRVNDNIGFFAHTVQLRGRLVTGDQLQSLGSEVVAPSIQPGWVLFDITDFVARAINERRNSVHFELSLPCGRSEAELTTVSLLDAEPRLIVEYR